VANKHREFNLEKIMNTKLMCTFLIIIAVIITFISSSEANVELENEIVKSYRISGEITTMDVNQIKNILQNKPAGERTIFYLNSTGGDIYAAMEIGKLIRKARAGCMILEGARCYSACVFVLAGGVNRAAAGGTVGIHRPFSTYVGNRDYQSTQKEYRRTETAIRTYFKEMNLPERLFEAMVLVPPEKIRILSYEELKAFGLSGTDPVEQETEDATDASNYGISKTELIRRKNMLDEVCPFVPGSQVDGEAWFDCRVAYMYGLDLSTYRARVARARNVCSGYKRGEEYGEEYKSCYFRTLRGDR
jgi:hypothetical protein